MLFKIENRFKICNLRLNLIYIDDMNQAQPIQSVDEPDYFIRVFFKREEAIMWYRVFEYQPKQARKLIKREQKIQTYSGQLNVAMKLELISLFMEQDTDLFLNASRILYSFSEPFYNYNREAEAF